MALEQRSGIGFHSPAVLTQGSCREMDRLQAGSAQGTETCCMAQCIRTAHIGKFLFLSGRYEVIAGGNGAGGSGLRITP